MIQGENDRFLSLTGVLTCKGPPKRSMIQGENDRFLSLTGVLTCKGPPKRSMIQGENDRFLSLTGILALDCTNDAGGSNSRNRSGDDSA
jgi:hypothetical protein